MLFQIETEIKLENLLTKADVDRAQKRLVNEVVEKSDPYVPFLTGRLRNTVRKSKYYVTYRPFNGGNVSYANIQYRTNRGMGKEGINRGGQRGSRWTERMWEDNREVIESIIASELTGGKK